MNLPLPPKYVTTDMMQRSHARAKLVCGFYGPTHPKCKQAVDHDTDLYLRFMDQFKIKDDDDTDTSE